MERFTSARDFEVALGALLVLNLIDAVCTSVWVSAGIVGEGNPVMAAAIELGYGYFVLGKVALVGLGVLGLYRLRAVRLARLAVLPAVLLYSFVVGTHLGIGARVLGLIERGIVFGAPLVGG
ncbi:MAG: hypothetical protein ACI8S6_001592 [Myxococcota bacterium]|jgi:hypothetical protein